MLNLAKGMVSAAKDRKFGKKPSLACYGAVVPNRSSSTPHYAFSRYQHNRHDGKSNPDKAKRQTDNCKLHIVFISRS